MSKQRAIKEYREHDSHRTQRSGRYSDEYSDDYTDYSSEAEDRPRAYNVVTSAPSGGRRKLYEDTVKREIVREIVRPATPSRVFRHVGVQMTTNYEVPKPKQRTFSTQTDTVRPPSPVVVEKPVYITKEAPAPRIVERYIRVRPTTPPPRVIVEKEVSTNKNIERTMFSFYI